MEPPRPEAIWQSLRDVSQLAREPMRISLGDSAAIILKRLLLRRTRDGDVVAEVPVEILSQQAAPDAMMHCHRLQLAHFQARDLPTHWQQPVHFHEPIGKIQTYLADAHDVFLNKRLSPRQTNRDDWPALAPQLDKHQRARLLLDDCACPLATPDLRERAVKNWYILHGETLAP